MGYPAGARSAPSSRARTSRPRIVPFWSRLPSIAFFPARGAAFLSLLLLTVLSLGGLVPIAGGFIRLGVWLLAYRYAFDILRHTADGHPGAPAFKFDNDERGAVWRLFAMMFLLFFGIGVVAGITHSKSLTLLAAVVLVLLQPGGVISLAMDGSLRKALNPAVLLGIATRIGWPYLAAFGLLFVIQVSTLTAAAWLHTTLPPAVSRLALTFATLWGLYATFHLLGYLVLQYHEALGYEPAALREPEQFDPDQRLLDEAGQLIEAGHLDEALDALRYAARTRTLGLSAHELQHRLLLQKRWLDEIREHGQSYLARLLDAGDDRRALNVWRETLAVLPDFAPASIEQATRLLERARGNGQFRLTCDALQAMLARWPEAPQAPQWALQAGMLLSERMGRDADARALLQHALARSDDADLQRRLQAALNAIPSA